MRNRYLYIVVFVAGAAVLAVEILGTRILGPFYGVSLFLWSALITVTLVALSAGYVVGGRWADKDPILPRLYYLLAGAGIWLLLMGWIKKPVLLIAEPFGLRFAVLIAAFILFVPPLTLLGMVSPYAIRVRAYSLNVVGRTAGDLYAISTIGSVISALITGFILIPNVGVSRLTLLIGVVLLIAAAIGMMFEMRSTAKQVATSMGTLLGATIVFLVPFNHLAPEEGLIAVEQSPYAEIRVVDKNHKRHLLIDGGLHSIVDTTNWSSHFPYTAIIDLTREFFKEPGEMLLIGLGGGSIAKNFASERWAVEAVEIDPVVIEIAHKYFGLQESEAEIYQMDGRRFLVTRAKNYDLIVMDAFGSSSIPFHLVTKESFGLIADHLAPDGILAINIMAKGWNDLIVRSLSATLKQHFEHVLALPAYIPTQEEVGNIVILASNEAYESRYEMKWSFRNPESRDMLKFKQRRAWFNRYIPETEDAPVLTDNLNPVDLWSEEINLSVRKQLHSYFETEGLGW